MLNMCNMTIQPSRYRRGSMLNSKILKFFLCRIIVQILNVLLHSASFMTIVAQVRHVAMVLLLFNSIPTGIFNIFNKIQKFTYQRKTVDRSVFIQ